MSNQAIVQIGLFLASAVSLAACHAQPGTTRQDGGNGFVQAPSNSSPLPASVSPAGAPEALTSSDWSPVGAGDPCHRVGEGRFASARSDACAGVWVIYASIPGGGTWLHDRDGDDRAAVAPRRAIAALQIRLSKCGIQAYVSLSDWFDRFAPDLAVIHSAPFADAQSARPTLDKARACGVEAYAKFSELQIVGRD